MSLKKSQDRITFDKIPEAPGEGEEIATILDFVMDQEFIEKHRHDWCWLGSKDVPTETGWYRVERKTNKLEKIEKIEVEKLMKQEPRRVGGINLFFHFPEALKDVEQKTKDLLKNVGNTCPVAKSIHPDIEVKVNWGEW